MAKKRVETSEDPEVETVERDDEQFDFDANYWDGDKAPEISPADVLIGRDVLNADDEKVGEIAHIMVDLPTGRAAYAVISVGGFLGIGDKFLPVPWTALTHESDEQCFRIDATKEELEAARAFEEGELPEMADQAWAEDLHGYYGARPYWH